MKLSALLILLALPAISGATATPTSAADAKGGKPGTNVDMRYVMAPLTGADGKLTGYAYLLSRLTAASENSAQDVVEKQPFIQDAFVRDVNSKSVATADDPQKVDVAGAEARLLADARKVMGAAKVTAITICTVQIAPLHPVQTPALSPPPVETGKDAATATNPLKSRCET